MTVRFLVTKEGDQYQVLIVEGARLLVSETSLEKAEEVKKNLELAFAGGRPPIVSKGRPLLAKADTPIPVPSTKTSAVAQMLREAS